MGNPDTEHCHADGALRMPPRVRLIAGFWLVVLVSFVLNDPRQPAPLAVAATMLTLIVLGKSAYGGLRWLIRESAIRFPEGIDPIPPKALLAKLVPWIGFGVAIPASVMVTMMFLIGGRPPWQAGYFLSLVLFSFIPTLILCLALLPLARAAAAGSELLSDRDRGVFPLSTMLMAYAVGGFFCIYDNPLRHGLWPMIKHFIHVVFKAALPYSWPQHVIAVAVACAVLRLWLHCTSGAVCPDKADSEQGKHD